MTYGTPGDKLRAYKAALITAAQAATVDLAQPGHELLVRNGRPSARQEKRFDDIIGATRMTGQRDYATAGTNRSLEQEMTVTLLISVWRPGTELDDEDDLQDQAEDQAYALLDAIAEHVRVGTNTTLGGVVRRCLLSSHDSPGQTDRDLIDRGRLSEINAVFTAWARISS